PGEDKNAFLRTMDVLESAGVGRIHAFPFSPRQGTPAAEFPERPDPGKVKERMKEILDFAAASQHRYASPFVGKTLPILVEKCDSGFVSGYTPHYVRVNAEGSFSVNGVAEVAMTNCRSGILHGRVCYNAHSGSAG
ncbi:MAG: MiaB-like tRNA modifying enzyme, partial [Synergistales bacterium 54_9]